MSAEPFWSYEPTASDLVELVAVGCLREAQEMTRLSRNKAVLPEVRRQREMLREARDELTRLIAELEANQPMEAA